MKKFYNIIVLATFALCSCQSKTSQETNSSTSFDAARTAFFSNLKPSAETAELLKATSVTFNAGMLHDPSQFQSYANNPTKAAINLGVYLADLNYSVAYQQTESTKALFSSAFELSKAMGIERSILDFLMTRYQANLEQNDSAKVVVNDLFDKSTHGLQGTDRERLAGIAMAAYQIENLHLALGLMESYPQDGSTGDRTKSLLPVYQLVLKQKINLEITYSFLTSTTEVTNPDKNPNYPFYATTFRELIDVYNQFPTGANGASTEVINDAMMGALGTKVSAIRSKIVSVD